MIITTITENEIEIAMVNSDDVIITDIQTALDLIATVSYQTGCDRMIINKSAVCEDFFDLKTRLAGDILQKYINYRMKVAIVGDYSGFTSKSLRDFITECNRGKDIFFLPDEKQAIEKLSMI